MILSITGLPGSGKTTIVKLLSQKLEVPWYSVGDLRGKMAKERGMTIDELNRMGETEAFTDKDVDDYQKTLGESNESFVIDGRLSWYFIPTSYKIFLRVDPDVAAERIFTASQKGERTDEPLYASIEEAKQFIENRIASDVRRYQKYYGVDFLDHKNYDLVIDTSLMTPEEVVNRVIEDGVVEIGKS